MFFAKISKITWNTKFLIKENVPKAMMTLGTLKTLKTFVID